MNGTAKASAEHLGESPVTAALESVELRDLRHPIRVLHFTTAESRGGAEEHIVRLLRHLNPRTFCFSLVCLPELAEQVRRDLPPEVEVLPLQLKEPTQLRPMIQLMKILQRRKIQILHSHMFCSSRCASPMGWIARVPIIIETPHVREAWRVGWKASFLFDRIVDRFVDQYVAVSEANASYLASMKRFSPSKITVIYPGCDVHKFSPEYPEPPELRKAAGLVQSDRIIVLLGRLEPQKGHRVIFEALPAILRSFPCARLVCVGEGSLRDELESLARRLGIEGAVRFVGYCSDVRGWLAAADLSVLPSFFEGLPGAVIESLAAGCPVVATSVDGTPEIVMDNKTGLLVPPGDPVALGHAICRMLADPQFARASAIDGRDWVLQHFGVNSLIDRTERLYLDAWARHLRQAK